jgi:hypothetical protein
MLRTEGQNKLECLPNQKSFIKQRRKLHYLLKTNSQNKLECLPNKKV